MGLIHVAFGQKDRAYSRSRAALAAAAMLFAITLSNAGSPVVSESAHVISAGSTVLAKSACFRVGATIGEAVAGYSSSSDYSLNGGFLAHESVANGDAIFFNTFEVCTP